MSRRNYDHAFENVPHLQLEKPSATEEDEFDGSKGIQGILKTHCRYSALVNIKLAYLR
jgi:hypothetical protein